MKLRQKIFFGIFGLAAVCVIVFAIFIQLASSPSRLLRLDLKIESIPSSVARLQLGDDEWQDVTRCYHFAIAPLDFPKLLAGRRFQAVTNDYTSRWETMRMDPPHSLSYHEMYRWRELGTECTIYPTDTHDEVIIMFTAMLTGN